jgi:AcrR family transcriptional regulator
MHPLPPGECWQIKQAFQQVSGCRGAIFCLDTKNDKYYKLSEIVWNCLFPFWRPQQIGKSMGRKKTTEFDAAATKKRIIDAAESLFREVGYSKTTVADIASALGMSPANVYRYFPTKASINESICDLLIRHIESKCYDALVKDGTSTERISYLILEYHKTIKINIIKEKRLYDMVAVAMEEHWPVIHDHTERIIELLRIIIEQGILFGEFKNKNPAALAKTVYTAISYFIYPTLVEHAINDDNDIPIDTIEEDLKQLLDLILYGLRQNHD